MCAFAILSCRHILQHPVTQMLLIFTEYVGPMVCPPKTIIFQDFRGPTFSRVVGCGGGGGVNRKTKPGKLASKG